MEKYNSRIEHTVLGPETTLIDVFEVMSTAADRNMKACIPPCYVKAANNEFPEVDISTVVGFPHGQTTSSVKAKEAEDAVSKGASEIDMVANIGFLKAEDFDSLRFEINKVVEEVNVPVKVIIETPLLTDLEKHKICSIVADCGADFVKTATGFSNGGATVEDVRLMSEYVPVKASGGIRSGETAKQMFDAGAERIGASRGEKILDELEMKK